LYERSALEHEQRHGLHEAVRGALQEHKKDSLTWGKTSGALLSEKITSREQLDAFLKGDGFDIVLDNFKDEFIVKAGIDSWNSRRFSSLLERHDVHDYFDSLIATLRSRSLLEMSDLEIQETIEPYWQAYRTQVEEIITWAIHLYRGHPQMLELQDRLANKLVLFPVHTWISQVDDDLQDEMFFLRKSWNKVVHTDQRIKMARALIQSGEWRQSFQGKGQFTKTIEELKDQCSRLVAEVNPVLRSLGGYRHFPLELVDQALRVAEERLKGVLGEELYADLDHYESTKKANHGLATTYGPKSIRKKTVSDRNLT
jgi:hypothetical protein